MAKMVVGTVVAGRSQHIFCTMVMGHWGHRTYARQMQCADSIFSPRYLLGSFFFSFFFLGLFWFHLHQRPERQREGCEDSSTHTFLRWGSCVVGSKHSEIMSHDTKGVAGYGRTIEMGFFIFSLDFFPLIFTLFA
ncbi:hypothetical protein F4824DRAFT_475206 [Ustulina deusta]|nr:hypothetical protein F4824DRAFT_475206 [Ustulina deusta]